MGEGIPARGRKSVLDLPRPLTDSLAMQRTTCCRQQFRRALACAGGIVLVALSGARATDYFVNPSGSNGAFPTVQSAVDAVVGQTATARANIFLAPARYVERVTVANHL